jgi:hypothetical protein
MRYIGRVKVLSLVELIYRVQEAYYHDWELNNTTAENMSKKDVQIVQQVIESC